MRILFIGDIVGSPGREIVRERLADIVAQQKVDLVIANCENAASGFGITPRLVEELLAAGVEVDAEASRKKRAMGWYLEGRVTAVIGTHTHVPTADEQILPGGTAFISDVGMTGPHAGIIGMDRDGIIKKFLNGLPARFEVAEGDVQLNAVLIVADTRSEEHTSELQSRLHLVCRLLLEKKKKLK